MPSIGLYPPTIDISKLVFVPEKEDQKYTVKFYLSQFNSHAEYNVVQCSVNYQQGGMSAIIKQDDETNDRYRKTNSIIMPKSRIITNEDDNSGSFTISNKDLQGEKWEIGRLYKIQVRLGSVKDINMIDKNTNQQDWLNEHNNEFSEWSTIAIIKPVKPAHIEIPPLSYNSDVSISGGGNSTEITSFLGNLLDFYGTFNMGEFMELLSAYSVKLFIEDMEAEDGWAEKEDSGTIYANNIHNLMEFRYAFHTELEEGKLYKVEFTYITENNYTDTLPLKFKCIYSGSKGLLTNLKVIVPDILDDIHGDTLVTNRVLLQQIDDFNNSSIEKEENKTYFPFNKFTTDLDNEEGRISIKICHTTDFGKLYSGNLMLVRSDNRSNYKHWEDIKIINLIQQDVNDLDIIYDYTVESGIIYSYGLQEIIVRKKDGNNIVKEYSRSSVSGEIIYLPSAMTDEGTSDIVNTPVIRDFEHSFLLGENGTQLKLKYDNEMGSFKIHVNDSKVETLGSKYPFVLRNGNTSYKTFPITGLISFSMDDNFLFATERDVYNNKATFNNKLAQNDIVTQYQIYNKRKYGYGSTVDNDNNSTNVGVDVDLSLWQYDYNYEHLFREKVLEFLTDGKPKLFKSVTEGNVIVRLMDVSTTPQQTLGRLLSKFTSNAHEIAEANLTNYLKYKFYTLGTIVADFTVKETHFGQLYIDCEESENGYDIIQEIYKKYTVDKSRKDELYYIKIEEIYDLEIEFQSQQPKDWDDRYLMYYNEKPIRVSRVPGVYHFDDIITFKIPEQGTKDALVLKNKTVAIVNFLYKTTKEPMKTSYLNKIITTRRVGQIYEHINKDVSIIKLIKQKHEFTIGSITQTVLQFTGVNIEADPGSLFAIRDKEEDFDTIFEIGPTGNLTLANVFNLDDIIYKGPNASADILIDYYFITERGEYKEVAITTQQGDNGDVTG